MLPCLLPKDSDVICCQECSNNRNQKNIKDWDWCSNKEIPETHDEIKQKVIV